MLAWETKVYWLPSLLWHPKINDSLLFFLLIPTFHLIGKLRQPEKKKT